MYPFTQSSLITFTCNTVNNFYLFEKNVVLARSIALRIPTSVQEEDYSVKKKIQKRVKSALLPIGRFFDLAILGSGSELFGFL